MLPAAPPLVTSQFGDLLKEFQMSITTTLQEWRTAGQYQRKRLTMGVYLTLPAIVILLAVLAYPILASLYLSFQKITLVSSGIETQFIGLQNYVQIFTDEAFQTAFLNSIYFTFVEVFFVLIISLALALLLNTPEGRPAFYRVVLLIPWALAPVANAILWKWIYNANYGILNQILVGLGWSKTGVVWLGSPFLALNMILLADVWKAVPFITLLLLAGLQNIPRYLYRAALLDGATTWQQFRHITLPGLQTSVVISTVLQSIWALKVFDLVFVLTKGGPADGTVLLNFLAWRVTFNYLDIGYGAAIADVLFVMMLLLALVYIRALRPRSTRRRIVE
jgi:ABC-type sugar transport system permease subunit